MVGELRKRGLFPEFPRDDFSGAMVSDWKYLVENGTRVTAEGTAENADTTIYTVASGKTLYIIALSMGSQNNATIAIPTATMELGNVTICSANSGKIDGQHEYVTMAFSTPFVVNAAETIDITSNKASCFARGSFLGYLI